MAIHGSSYEIVGKAESFLTPTQLPNIIVKITSNRSNRSLVLSSPLFKESSPTDISLPFFFRSFI